MSAQTISNNPACKLFREEILAKASDANLSSHCPHCAVVNVICPISFHPSNLQHVHQKGRPVVVTSPMMSDVPVGESANHEQKGVNQQQVIIVQPFQFQPTSYQPQTGKWKDDICNCFSNLWPSCCCVALGSGTCGILPMWLAAQIAHRIGFGKSRFWIIRYAIILAVTFVVGIIIAAAAAAAGGVSIVFFYGPQWWFLVFLVLLRYRFVRVFQIQEDPLETCCYGFWLASCSLCQMARHLYGYEAHFEGDALLDGMMVYPPEMGQSWRDPKNAGAYGAYGCLV